MIRQIKISGVIFFEVDLVISLGVINTLLSFPWTGAIALKPPLFRPLGYICTYQCGNDLFFKGTHNPIRLSQRIS